MTAALSQEEANCGLMCHIGPTACFVWPVISENLLTFVKSLKKTKQNKQTHKYAKTTQHRYLLSAPYRKCYCEPLHFFHDGTYFIHLVHYCNRTTNVPKHIRRVLPICVREGRDCDYSQVTIKY